MLSLILATYNGAATLPRTLDSLTRLDRPSQGWEIIVVDNASNDQTHEVLESYLDKIPMKILYEPRQGKSFALNKGIANAKGSLIVFTDDDIIPEINWLISYTEAAERHPGIGIFAGQVRHEWDAPPPYWLNYLAEMGKSYGGTPIDFKEQEVSYGEVKGCNLMVRRSAMAHIRFSEDEGINFDGQRASSGGEDTLFARQIAESSNGILFVPEACVRHIVRVDQVGVKPVFSRYMRIGGTRPIEAKGGITVLGYPFWGLRQAFSYFAKCLAWFVRGHSGEAAVYMVRLASTLGGLREGARLRHAKKISSHPFSKGNQ